LLPEAALKEQLQEMKEAGKKKGWGWTPWLYQYAGEIKMS
jgi:hypothetical protein